MRVNYQRRLVFISDNLRLLFTGLVGFKIICCFFLMTSLPIHTIGVLLIVFLSIQILQLLFFKSECVSWEFQFHKAFCAEVIQNILINEFVLTDTLNHAIALLSQSSNHSKDGYSWLILSLCLWIIFQKNPQRLNNVVNCYDSSSSSDTCTTVEYNLANQFSIFTLNYFVTILFCNLRILILLNKLYQLLNDLEVSLLWSTMIWPGEVV